jgi:hypothetical protein
MTSQAIAPAQCSHNEVVCLLLISDKKTKEFNKRELTDLD